MSQHLVNVHGVEAKSEQQKELLSKAFVFGKKPNLKQSAIKKTRIDDISSQYKLDVSEHNFTKKPKLQSDFEADSAFDDVHNFDLTNSDYEDDSNVTSSDGEGNEQSQADGTIGKVFDWLISTDGGHLDKKTANQHVKQQRRILSKIDPDENLSSLLDFSLIRDVFMKHAEATYVVGTIKSYLMSLQHFYSYLQAD